MGGVRGCSTEWPPNEKLFIEGDFNGHIGEKKDGYDITHGGFGFGDRNSGGVAILDFALAFDLMIVNSVFKKKENHLVTFRSGSSKTQIDCFLIRANHRRMCKDSKVIPSELLGTQHRLLVMDSKINQLIKQNPNLPKLYQDSKIIDYTIKALLSPIWSIKC